MVLICKRISATYLNDKGKENSVSTMADDIKKIENWEKKIENLQDNSDSHSNRNANANSISNSSIVPGDSSSLHEQSQNPNRLGLSNLPRDSTPTSQSQTN